MSEISFWVDVSACSGGILLLATAVVLSVEARPAESRGSAFIRIVGFFLIFVCPAGWLGLHAAACKKAAQYASEKISFKGSF
jgi:hypothetical protein